MGLEVATLSLIVAGAGTVASVKNQMDARSSAAAAADQQRRAQSEQRAVVASQQAADRRAQIREERVRRARLLQGSENTGTAFSSGETGGVGNIATGYFSNLGTSLGSEQSAANISTFQQNAANFNYETQQSLQESQMFTQLTHLSSNIFDMSAKNNKIIPTTPSTSSSGPNLSTADYLAIRDQ